MATSFRPRSLLRLQRRHRRQRQRLRRLPLTPPWLWPHPRRPYRGRLSGTGGHRLGQCRHLPPSPVRCGMRRMRRTTQTTQAATALHVPGLYLHLHLLRLRLRPQPLHLRRPHTLRPPTRRRRPLPTPHRPMDAAAAVPRWHPHRRQCQRCHCRLPHRRPTMPARPCRTRRRSRLCRSPSRRRRSR
jgi:hypothetical protein